MLSAKTPLSKVSLGSSMHTKSHTFMFTSDISGSDLWYFWLSAYLPLSQASVFQYILPTSACFWQKGDRGNWQLASSSSQQMRRAGKEGNSAANGADGAWPYCVHLALPFNERILPLALNSSFCGCCKPKASQQLVTQLDAKNLFS